ncbi:MAG: penicillin-binding protein 1C [bacterium]|nr:penicillin-binding protein 1C [bacterium]
MMRHPLGKATAGLLCMGLAILLWPMDTGSYLRVHASGELQDCQGVLLYTVLNPEENWCFERSLDQISPRLIQATIATEDHRIDSHLGIDPIAVTRALWQNLTQQRVVSGASTLAMQVVKFQHPRTNTIPGKLLQAVQAIRLRLRASKEDLLWAYLNNAPYGANLVGCEAAARRYFGKPARELTLAEAALLAGLPKSPTRYMPLRYPERARQRRDFVLQRMREEGMISAKEEQAARRSGLTTRYHEYPKTAPHLAFALNSRLARGEQVRTTLDDSIQRSVEAILFRAAERSRGEIDNAAAMVIDVSSAQVLARAGSADFFNPAIQGQVDVCLAERSPGSTLKPFSFALAIESNRLYHSEILLDDLWDQGLYNPENFDQSFKGLISASDALKTSRNIPSISVLERVGIEGFHGFLKQLHFSTLYQGAEHYGLGIILGNCEVKMEELAAAYTMLASLGVYRPLRIKMDEKAQPGQRLLAPGTCLNLYSMLEQPLPNDLQAVGLPKVSVIPRVCWKTGTSQGYRDAWTVMFNRQYLVIVWRGNNDGRGSSLLIGSQVALPLAADIFLSLKLQNKPAWPPVDDNLREVPVCSRSGLPATRWCLHTESVFLPKTQFLNRRCDMHYPVKTEAAFALDSIPYATSVIERWPASPQGWNLANIRFPYVIQPKEITVARDTELRILSPANEAEFLLTHQPEADRIQLKSSLDQEGAVHWYWNETFFGTSTPFQPLFLHLTPGVHTVSCMTESGQISRVSFSAFVPE